MTALVLDLDEDEFEAPMPKAVFVIDTEERANWFLAKLGNLDAERARVKAQAAAMLADLDKREQSLRTRFEPDLEVWARAELERRRAKTKTLKLLQGNISFRRVPGGLRLTDADAAMDHAKVLGATEEIVTMRIDKARYVAMAGDALGKTGELLPGVEMIADRESMSIRFGKPEGE